MDLYTNKSCYNYTTDYTTYNLNTFYTCNLATKTIFFPLSTSPLEKNLPPILRKLNKLSK